MFNTNIDNPVYLPPDLVINQEVVLQANDSWSITPELKELQTKFDGKGITAAVLDTGMNDHQSLPEPVAARSFISGESWRDGNGHGTHCAGTVLGRVEGTSPAIGVAPAAALIVGKVLSNRGSGSSQGIADGIVWACDQGADVISLSLGSGSGYKPLHDAILYAWKNGTVIVAAAGNSGFNGSRNTIGYPGKYLESICVGSYQRNGERSSFSSGGREIDVVGPGSNIISASHRGRNLYTEMSGTSMATPFIAGLTVLLLSQLKRQGIPGFGSEEDYRGFLSQYCIDKGSPGFDEAWGWGIPKSTEMIKALSLNLSYLGQ